ncbi:hypothetical protein [Gottfriedia acidiceleris]|uniref:hypothetical protein n=1 Tax=Gottfriedia acidiceleris TaxID=371036 RepID=UPI000B430CE3|nr:hypothetical protein [Gottfriedia acidiceleris]
MKISKVKVHRVNSQNHKASFWVFTQIDKEEEKKQLVIIEGNGRVSPKEFQNFHDEILSANSVAIPLAMQGFKSKIHKKFMDKNKLEHT